MNILNKRNIIIGICCVLAIGLAIGLIIFFSTNYNNLNDNELNNNSTYSITEKDGLFTVSNAVWDPVENDDEPSGIIAASTLVGKGKIIDQYTEIRGVGEDAVAGEEDPMVFTISKVEITKLYSLDETKANNVIHDIKKGNLIVEIVQTGGDQDGIKTPEISDAPLLKDNSEYLLMIEKTDEGRYIPVGGRLGYAEIIDNRICYINDETRQLFSDLNNKQIDSFPDKLETIMKNAPKDIQSSSKNNVVLNEVDDSTSKFIKKTIIE